MSVTSPLAWTGERMVPHQSDPITEAFHWQRYLYFRPWYVDQKVVDAASGEGYGTGYTAIFATSSTGVDVSQEAVDYASNRYPKANFIEADVTSFDYSKADLVLSFETIEHLEDPGAFLNSLDKCQGTIVVSTPNRDNHSPGNKLGDKPFNPFHTVEWVPEEFAKLIREHFPHREVRFVSQEAIWPGRIREGLYGDAKYTIAIIGERPLPKWPSIGISMPTIDQPARVEAAVDSFAKYYPGDVRVMAVLNGSSPATETRLRNVANTYPHILSVVKEPVNLGYGLGANRGLLELLKDTDIEVLGVSNDDVVVSVDCIPQLATALVELYQGGFRVGAVGPVSNTVCGGQQVDIGHYTTVAEMHQLAFEWGESQKNTADQENIVRGLFFLSPRECIEEIGGFDPLFGIGNFEDDDWNVRVRLSGRTLWKIPGAFIHHEGSMTFKSLGIDYEGNIDRNLHLFLEKWGVTEYQQAFEPLEKPVGVSLSVALDSQFPSSGNSIPINGEDVDLVLQASNLEFAAWVATQLNNKDRELRKDLIRLLL